MSSRFRVRGLRVVHQPHPGRLTAIALTVRAGARYDGRHPGLAHLAEHMLFQGTDGLDQVALNRRAAELGGEHNADTGYEDIALTFEVFNEDFDDALALLAEQYYRTAVDRPTLRKEQRVVMEEIRGRLDDPADRVYRRAWSRMFRGALAHPVAGTLASVARIQPADVTRFLRRRLSHANTVLAVVGGVPLARVRAAVRRHFRHGAPSPADVPVPVRWGRGGPLRVHDQDSSQAYLTVLMPVRPTPRTLLATGVAVDVVGADPDSRLFQELRERLGLSYEVGAHLEWGPDWACAVISASGARNRAGRLARAVEETCRRAADEGFEVDELDRARKKLRYRYAILADSRLDSAVALAESALWDFPTPAETERIVARLSHREVEAAWRAAVRARGVRALLT
ncbi:MAG: pitrilysin family protein [Deltaproteobacteria bacterium]|nr:pitrilysin family protein [Deltaproteobacteria bacterium]